MEKIHFAAGKKNVTSPNEGKWFLHLYFLCLNHLPLLCSSCWMHTPPKYVEYKNNNSTALFWWLDYWKGLNVKEKIPFPQSWSIRCAGRIMFSLLLLKSFSPHTDRTFLSPVSAVFTTWCMKTFSQGKGVVFAGLSKLWTSVLGSKWNMG